eukprot:COSAG01_NODE_5663_length_4113_cov_2.043847_1_plen_214_part_00
MSEATATATAQEGEVLEEDGKALRLERGCLVDIFDSADNGVYEGSGRVQHVFPHACMCAFEPNMLVWNIHPRLRHIIYKFVEVDEAENRSVIHMAVHGMADPCRHEEEDGAGESVHSGEPVHAAARQLIAYPPTKHYEVVKLRTSEMLGYYPICAGKALGPCESLGCEDGCRSVVLVEVEDPQDHTLHHFTFFASSCKVVEAAPRLHSKFRVQ